MTPAVSLVVIAYREAERVLAGQGARRPQADASGSIRIERSSTASTARRGASVWLVGGAAALALLAAGALIAAPTLTGLISRAANRPGSERGSRKRLEGIRNGSVPENEDFYSLDEAALL